MIKELLVGMEAAEQLRRQILSTNSDPFTDYRDDDGDHHEVVNHSLIDKMLSSFDKTITILAKSIPSLDHTTTNYFQSESPPSLPLISSPAGSHNSNPPSKKRKTMPRWTKRVQFCAGGPPSGLDGDGFNWRKYGQKDILGAKFPRGYYRCTHRHSQGCAATKQVQRSDENPSIYLIIYRGEHTCTHGPLLSQAQTKANPVQIKTEPHPKILPTPQEEYQNAQLPPQQEIFLGLGLDGDLKFEQAENIFRSLSFTSGLLETGPIDSYILGCSPAFGSPATSDSNYIPISPYQVTGNGAGLFVQTPESDLNEAISGPNSVTNSPIMGEFEFPLDQLLDIDANFPFEF